MTATPVQQLKLVLPFAVLELVSPLPVESPIPGANFIKLFSTVICE